MSGNVRLGFKIIPGRLGPAGRGDAGAVDISLGPSDIGTVGMICCGAGGVTGIGLSTGRFAGERPIGIVVFNVDGPPKPVICRAT